MGETEGEMTSNAIHDKPWVEPWVEPWIDTDGAGKEKIIETSRRYPSGALSYLEDGQVPTNFHELAKIQISRDGPITFAATAASANTWVSSLRP